MNQTNQNSSSKFKINTPKPIVNPEALEAFAASAAGSIATPQLQSIPVNQAISNISNSSRSVDRTKGFLLRLLPEQFERVEQVFAQSTFKSKQTMGEKIFMDAIEELAKKIGV